MTMTTMATGTRTMETPAKTRRSLEELADRLFSTQTFPDDPEPDAVVDPHQDPARQPQRSLEELVDRLMATLTFRGEPEMAPVTASQGLVRDIHEARRHRQQGNLDGALETLAGAVPTSVSPSLARWAFTEWKHLVKRRFGQLAPLGLQPGNGACRCPGARESRRNP